jgi:t-SNARE complex subunit (syntaxin)
MQTSKTSKDLTVATKKIPKAGENRIILYAIIFISIIASVLFIKYYKINKIMKS